MKEIKILHLFPKLLSLYGEYGNISVLVSALRNAGYEVTTETYESGALALQGYDMIYVGAGTEDNLLEAIRRLMPNKEAITASVENGQLWLATGNAMTLFGTTVTREGNTTDSLACLPFRTTIHDEKRYLGDVLSEDALAGAFVGFINTSCVYEGITDPLLQLRLGNTLGNDKHSANEGIHTGRFYGTQLIGPILAKNPHFLQHICRELTGEEILLPTDSYAQKAYNVALAELQKRAE